MKNYYMVYDMSSWDEKNATFLQLGIGEKNENLDIAKVQYDVKYNFYWPEPESLDQSVEMAGYDNPYDTNQYDKREEMREDGVFPDGKSAPTKHDGILGWFEANKMLAIIGASAFVFLLLTIITCCCCFKGKKKRIDSYMYKTYSQMNPEASTSLNEAEQLDDDANKGI